MKVKIKPEYCDNPEEEDRIVHEVIEDNGDRLLIRPINCCENWTIKPTEKVEKYMVEVVE